MKLLTGCYLRWIAVRSAVHAFLYVRYRHLISGCYLALLSCLPPYAGVPSAVILCACCCPWNKVRVWEKVGEDISGRYYDWFLHCPGPACGRAQGRLVWRSDLSLPWPNQDENEATHACISHYFYIHFAPVLYRGGARMKNSATYAGAPEVSVGYLSFHAD